MLYRLTFRKTDDNCLHVTAYPDKQVEDSHLLVGDHVDPTVFNAALGLAGVSTESESDLAVAAEKAWKSPGLDVCCEAADLMDGQLHTLGLRPPGE
jgi:hypothetical protein